MLSTSMAYAQMPGAVLVQTDGLESNTRVFDPYGADITTALGCASSHTLCFQEGINRAEADGQNFKAQCFTTAGDRNFITMTAGLVVGPATGMDFEIEGCSVEWTSAVGSSPGISIDTLDQGSVFNWPSGWLAYSGSGVVVLVNPHTATPVGGKAFQFSSVTLPYMEGLAPLNPAVVKFQSTVDGFSIANWNKFRFLGEDATAGVFTGYCIEVADTVYPSNAVAQNDIDFGSCQNPLTMGIHVGTKAAQPGVIATNIWHGMIGIGGPTVYGILTYGFLDQWYLSNVSVNAGSLNTGIYLGNNDNYIVAPQMQGSLAVNQAAGVTGNCGIINQKQKACGSTW